MRQAWTYEPIERYTVPVSSKKVAKARRVNRACYERSAANINAVLAEARARGLTYGQMVVLREQERGRTSQ